MADPGSGHTLSAKVDTTIETREMAVLWCEAKRVELENQVTRTELEIKDLQEIKIRGLKTRLLVLKQQLSNLDDVEKNDVPKLSYKGEK